MAVRHLPTSRLLGAVCLLWGFLVWVCPLQAGELPSPMPFSVGEELVYEVRWEMVPTANATMRVSGLTEVDGTPAYHLEFTAQTLPWADIFFKVRNHFQSYPARDFSRSLRFTKKQREGSYKRDVVLAFDWDRLRVTRYRKGEEQKEHPLLYPGTLDPLSLFYGFRLGDYEEGRTIVRPVTDGKKVVYARATCGPVEEISVPAGSFRAFTAEPDLSHVGGVFKKSPDATMRVWVSADERRLPLKVVSSVLIGRFIAELVRYTPGPGSRSEGEPPETLDAEDLAAHTPVP